MKLFKLPQNLRPKLRKPLGKLFKNEDVNKIRKELELTNFVVTVGDATTERIHELGVKPKIQVVDLKEKRMKRVEPIANYDKLICTKNPAGNISEESLKVIKQAIKSEKSVRILVDGEEDLLALPLIALLPDNALLAYGQPSKGLVIVSISEGKRKMAKDILKQMKITEEYLKF